MERIKNGLTEKNISTKGNINDSKCSDIDKTQVKFVNGEGNDNHFDSEMDSNNLMNGSDSDEVGQFKEDVKNKEPTEVKDIDMMDSNGNEEEENLNGEKENGFEDISDAEPELGCSINRNDEKENVNKLDELMDVDKSDNEEHTKEEEMDFLQEKSGESTDSNVSQSALDNITSEEGSTCENAKNSLVECNKIKQDKQDSDSDKPSTDNSLQQEAPETELKISEVTSLGVNHKSIEAENEKEEIEKNKKLTDKEIYDQNKPESGSVKYEESKEAVHAKDGSKPGSPTQPSKKSDEVIVLDDGDDEKESGKKEDNKSTTVKKTPIIVNYYSMNNEQKPQASENSVQLSKESTTKDPSQSKPQPVPEFAKDLRPMAMNLCTIGMNLVREHVYNDLIKIQSKKLSQNKLNDMAQKQLDIIKTAAKALESENKPFQMNLKECVRDGDVPCGFQTESDSVMELHKDFPHGNIANFHCSYCEFFSTRKQDLVFHMEAIHMKQARFVPSFSYLVCCFCKFETESPKGFNKHVIKCAKTFNLKRNLEPSPADCDIPLKKPKPTKAALTRNSRQVTLPSKQLPGNQTTPQAKFTQKGALEVVTGGSKQTLTIHPSAVTPRATTTTNAIIRPQAPRPAAGMIPQQLSKLIASGIRTTGNVPYSYPQYLIGNTYYTVVNHNGQLMLQPSTVVSQGSAGVRPSVPVAVTGPRTPVAALPPIKVPGVSLNPQQANKPPVHILDQKKITPPKTIPKKSVRAILDQKKSAPDTTALSTGVKPSGFKICEICGGFVKDVQSLRIHFFWKHNVDIPKEVDEPGFSCFLCESPKSFWTIRGLQLHQSQDHGMGSATKSTNKTKVTPVKKKEGTAAKPIVLSPDKSTKIGPNHGCYLCGIQTNAILQHLLDSHRVSINTMSKMKKCLVCGLELGSQINLHTHLQGTHGLDTQIRGMSPAGIKTPVKVAEMKEGPASATVCQICKISFSSQRSYTKHFETHHSHKCYRCDKTWSTKDALLRHYDTSHKMDKDDCQLCGASVMIGSSFIRHVKRQHLKSFSVVLDRLDDDQMKKWVKNPIISSLVTPDINGKKNVEKDKTEHEDGSNCVQEVIEVDGEKIILEVYSSDEEKEES